MTAESAVSLIKVGFYNLLILLANRKAYIAVLNYL